MRRGRDLEAAHFRRHVAQRNPRSVRLGRALNPNEVLMRWRGELFPPREDCAADQVRVWQHGLAQHPFKQPDQIWMMLQRVELGQLVHPAINTHEVRLRLDGESAHVSDAVRQWRAGFHPATVARNGETLTPKTLQRFGRQQATDEQVTVLPDAGEELASVVHRPGRVKKRFH